MATYQEALQAKERLVRRWNKMPGVVGIGIGYANGKNRKDGLCVVLYTVNASTAMRRSCLQSVALKKKKRLGTKVPVRVIVSGRCSCQPGVFARANSRSTRDRIRPVVAGYSVGFPEVSGTAGLIVRASHSEQRYLLSNNHVLNRDNSSSLSKTIQPGGADGGFAPRDTIGRLYRFVQLRKDRANLMDAAISIPRSNALLAPRYARVGRVRGYVRSYALGARLKKVGRTTGFARGVVVSVNTDMIVDYGSYGGLGRIRFRNQTVIRGSRPVSLAGDSGSVWLTATDWQRECLAERNGNKLSLKSTDFKDSLFSLSLPAPHEKATTTVYCFCCCCCCCWAWMAD